MGIADFGNPQVSILGCTDQGRPTPGMRWPTNKNGDRHPVYLFFFESKMGTDTLFTYFSLSSGCISQKELGKQGVCPLFW
jgi:hypothetical protein